MNDDRGYSILDSGVIVVDDTALPPGWTVSGKSRCRICNAACPFLDPRGLRVHPSCEIELAAHVLDDWSGSLSVPPAGVDDAPVPEAGIGPVESSWRGAPLAAVRRQHSTAVLARAQEAMRGAAERARQRADEEKRVRSQLPELNEETT